MKGGDSMKESKNQVSAMVITDTAESAKYE